MPNIKGKIVISPSQKLMIKIAEGVLLEFLDNSVKNEESRKLIGELLGPLQDKLNAFNPPEAA